MREKTRQPAIVALGVSAAILAVEVLWPTRAHPPHELLIASRVRAGALKNMEVGIIAMIGDTRYVA
jgi:hypothetical protein